MIITIALLGGARATLPHIIAYIDYTLLFSFFFFATACTETVEYMTRDVTAPMLRAACLNN